MDSLWFWVIVFVASLFALVRGADFFTHSAEKLGEWLGMSEFLVGVVIVAAGTSLPELVSCLMAVREGATEFVSGNAIGSNIANILLVIGVASSFSSQLVFRRRRLRADLWILAASAGGLIVLCWDGRVTMIEGIALLIALVVYFTWCAFSDVGVVIETSKEEVPRPTVGKVSRTLFVLVVSGAVIYLGAEYTVRSVVKLSVMLGIGAEVIAAAVVALGTSLPELAVSVSAARRGEADIAVGNVIGSNIFNTLAVIGAPAVVSTLLVPRDMMLLGLPVMGGATVLFIYIVRDRRITRWEGVVSLACYVSFVASLFVFFR